jgi:hypothetical protein
MLRAMARVHDYRNTGEARGQNAVVMDEVVMSMQHVRTVLSQLLRELPDRAQLRSGPLSERSHAYSICFRFRGKLAGVGQAIYRRLVAVSKLTPRKVNCEPLQPSHIEIVDELDNSHDVNRPFS